MQAGVKTECGANTHGTCGVAVCVDNRAPGHQLFVELSHERREKHQGIMRKDVGRMDGLQHGHQVSSSYNIILAPLPLFPHALAVLS